MSKIIVSPSILSADFSNLENQLKIVQDYGAQWIHIDVMDGIFVPNITIGPCVVKSLKEKSTLFFDVHLMIQNPKRYIKDFIDAGADLITFHYESLDCQDSVRETIDIIKRAKKKVGIAIKPETSVSLVKKYLSDVDLLLIMTVEPGFGGQKFMEDIAIAKIKEAFSIVGNDFLIQVDGGINDKTCNICKNLGANVFVAGNYIYKSDNIKEAIENLLS